MLEQLDEAVGKALGISRRIKVDGEFLALRHLPEVREIGAYDRNTVRARQMRNATASC